MGRLLRNWHLKLAALALATILYTGFVYSGTFTEQPFDGVPIRDIGQPPSTFVSPQQLGTVDVRYRATSTTTVTAEAFDVTVDLSAYDMSQSGEPQALPVAVRSLNDNVTVLNFSPTTVSVTIDRVAEKEIPVVVETGTTPAGLIIGTPQVSTDTVTARGPASALDQIDHARAFVRIDQSGVAVSGQVVLEAVDVRGEVVSQGILLTPDAVLVEINVRPALTTKVVGVRPSITGAPATGFDVGAVTVDPPTITLRGLAADLAPITEVVTAPISIAGIRAAATFDAAVVVPDGVELGPIEEDTVSVRVTVRASSASRTFLVGATCVNVSTGSACLPQTDQLALTLTGPGAALDALSAADLTLLLDVAGLGPGSHAVTPAVPALPVGVELVSISPASVSVVISPPATPTPTPAP
jgi:YbbR domain-containing protein